MGEVSTVGLDLAKSVFQVHGADDKGAVVIRKKLTARSLARVLCRTSATAWLRWKHAQALITGHVRLASLGHEVRLIPPAYVKPFVKRQKNDMADAEAICEAAQRPTMRFVQPKTAEAQGAAVIFRARDLLVRQRTQLINALRGHLVEFGFVVRKGASNVGQLISLVEDPSSDLSRPTHG